MWGYQGHFRCNQEVHAKSVFRLLDQRFDPEVFLVGVLVEERADCHAACVEPEDDFWIASEAFVDVIEAAKSLPRTYPESQIWHSHPRVQENETERLWRRAIHEMMRKTIAEHPAKPERMLYFASFPVKRDVYLVSTVLGLQEDVISSHACLRVDRAQIHEYRSYKPAVSLIDAAIDEFLKDAASELGTPDAGEGLGSPRTPGELISSAGSRLMMDCAYKADRDLDQIGCWQRLFDACNAISSLGYERAAACGRAIVARREHSSVRPAITFSQPVSLQNLRGARKLLELASRGLVLHMNARFIFGLVEIGEYASELEDLFEINLLGYHRWELAHAGQSLMHVHAGQPQLPAAPFDKAKLRSDLTRIFRELPPSHADRLVSLVEAIATEKHGTMLVVVEDAADEARRLGKQGTTIQPWSATPELIKHVTAIDGAVLLGPDAVCHAIGVILDGLATPNGDPARGARFNSAVRYVEAQMKPCLAIVVSEDGGVDLIPDLRPTVRRSEIERVIRELEVVLSETSIRLRYFNGLVDWLEAHTFYLLEEHCVKVNDLIRRIDERVAQQYPSAFHVIRRGFAPHADLDPTFYYENE